MTSSAAKGSDTKKIHRQHQFFSCELIQEAGILLKLPQVVTVIAQTICHEFYTRQSIEDFDGFRVAMTCIFLSAKVNEKGRRITQVLNTFNHILQKRRYKTGHQSQPLVHGSQRYVLWRNTLLSTEKQVLINLGFGMYRLMDSPHKFILYFIKVLDGSASLAQKAWNYLNDSCRLDLCVRFPAQTIACAAIYLAAKALEIALPLSPPWWTVFDTSEAQLQSICEEIEQMYENEPLIWLEPLNPNARYVLGPDEVQTLEEAPSPSPANAKRDLPPEKQVPTNTEEHKQPPPTGEDSHPRSRRRSRSREWRRSPKTRRDRSRDRRRRDSSRSRSSDRSRHRRRRRSRSRSTDRERKRRR